MFQCQAVGMTKEEIKNHDRDHHVDKGEPPLFFCYDPKCPFRSTGLRETRHHEIGKDGHIKRAEAAGTHISCHVCKDYSGPAKEFHQHFTQEHRIECKAPSCPVRELYESFDELAGHLAASPSCQESHMGTNSRCFEYPRCHQTMNEQPLLWPHERDEHVYNAEWKSDTMGHLAPSLEDKAQDFYLKRLHRYKEFMRTHGRPFVCPERSCHCTYPEKAGLDSHLRKTRSHMPPGYETATKSAEEEALHCTHPPQEFDFAASPSQDLQQHTSGSLPGNFSASQLQRYGSLDSGASFTTTMGNSLPSTPHQDVLHQVPGFTNAPSYIQNNLNQNFLMHSGISTYRLSFQPLSPSIL
ncbi:hypothetical protein T439DRAFT_42267 [Meredithblackwellia eburnea MCA 4105]